MVNPVVGGGGFPLAGGPSGTGSFGGGAFLLAGGPSGAGCCAVLGRGVGSAAFVGGSLGEVVCSQGSTGLPGQYPVGGALGFGTVVLEGFGIEVEEDVGTACFAMGCCVCDCAAGCAAGAGIGMGCAVGSGAAGTDVGMGCAFGGALSALVVAMGVRGGTNSSYMSGNTGMWSSHVWGTRYVSTGSNVCFRSRVAMSA